MWHSASSTSSSAMTWLSREDFINCLLSENLDREDSDMIECACGVQQLVKVCAQQSGEWGRAQAAATRLRKDRSWVTNPLALRSPEELQLKLSSDGISEGDNQSPARLLKDDPGLDTAGLLGRLASAKDALNEQREDQPRWLVAGQQVVRRQRTGTYLERLRVKH